MDPIYLDYNATTPIDNAVAKAMEPFLSTNFGNPSSLHTYGVKAKQAVMTARQQAANLLNCSAAEIIFTSGGTEANNYAIKGAAFANRHKGTHIITSNIEHPAVTEVCRYLSGQGFEITWVEVDPYGMVDAESVRKAIRKDTILITVMHANNEVGTVQPIAEIGEIAREKQILFHTDAAQSLGKIEVDVKALGVDLLSVAGHKFYGPKGVGALYIRQGVKIDKLIHGADHEMNLRAGTENVLEIAGLGMACELAGNSLVSKAEHMRKLRDDLHKGITRQLPAAKLNGHPIHRLPNTLSLSFPGVEANTLLSEMQEVAASAGAACHTDSIDISPVLTAMQVPKEFAMGTIRFSTGKYTTSDEIKSAISHVVKTVTRLQGDGGSLPDPDMDSAEIKLTQFTHGMGCACKIRPQYLEEILREMPVPDDPNVLVSLSSSDDAAVYKVDEQTTIIQTVDFFTPIVDDPYQFGAIAAANAISDIYAMGGTPLFALNVVGFPENRLPARVLKDILKGASDKAREAGIYILGGHTVEDPEPKFGMTVTGVVHPDKVLRNDTLVEGDALVLTKPLGTGLIATAIKRGLANEEISNKAIQSMSQLNAGAADVMKNFEVHACTDVTGFGLLGHLVEMARPGKFDITLEMDAIPFLPGAAQFAANNIVPGGTLNNLAFVEPYVVYDENLSEIQKIMVNDAQTSGGLLIALPWILKDELIRELKAKDLPNSRCIGRVMKRKNGNIFIG